MTEYAGPYQRWNDALATRFFRGEQAGRRVYLYVTDDVIGSVGQSLGGGHHDFVAACKSGPPWVRLGSVCARALDSYTDWRRRDLLYPPYLAYLCLFVLAAGTEADFATNAYYPRLRRLLGLPVDGGRLPDFEHMWMLWEDLEMWSTQDRRGELGVFEARTHEFFVHVGYPLGQRLLSDFERSDLPRVFWEAEIDASGGYSDSELIAALTRHGGDVLRPRTLRLLSGAEGEAARTLLIDLVRDELGAWDGTFAPPDGDPGVPQARGSVVYGARLDPVAERVRLYLRCRLSVAFPETGLVLRDDSGTAYSCEEATSGWSTPLHDPGGEVDASKFLATPIALVESQLGWQFKGRSTAVRAFIHGALENLPDWIETRTLPTDRPVAILFASSVRAQIDKWLGESCDGVTRWKPAGLPADWSLATVRAVRSDQLLRQVTTLGFPATTRIQFVGGIRSGGGTSYFDFALPRVYVEGGLSTDTLTVGGTEVLARDEQGRLELPAPTSVSPRIGIHVVRSGEVVARRGLTVSGPGIWRSREARAASDRWGEAHDEKQAPSIVGALTVGMPPPPPFYPYPFLLPELRSVAERELYFVGRSPGEVAEWPADGLPAGWTPVWALRKQKRKKVLFCGRSVADALPCTVAQGSPQQVNLWRTLIWFDRGRRPPPDNARLRELWFQYQAVARSV